jgi:2-methylcitrate dehydratase PrpD
LSVPLQDASLTARLIRVGLDLRWDDLPPEAAEAAKFFLLDTLTVGFAGGATAEAGRVRAAVKGWRADAAATVIGQSLRLPTAEAALVNGFQVHCLEWDCVHEGAVVHAMSVPTAALLARAAEIPQLGGAVFLAALAAAVDLAVNLGVAATSPIRFFRPATAGVIGAALGLAKIAGVSSVERAADFLGLAYSQAAGTMQAHVEGSVALPIQIGVAARAAITAADLAQAGVGGPHDIIQGPFGYYSLIEARADLTRIEERLGRTFGIAELSQKPFPTGRAAHAVLDGLAKLAAREGLCADDVASIDAFVPPLIARLVGRRPMLGMAPSYARLCLPFLAASQLTHGPLGPESYTQARLSSPTLWNLADRIRVLPDGASDPNAMSPQRFTLTTAGGERFDVAIPDTLGSPRNPLTEAERRAKAMACLTPVFGGAASERLEELRAAIDALPGGDCARLLSLLAR